MNFQLIIFDFDGTLCATHNAIIHCVTATFGRFGRMPPDPTAVLTTIRKGVDLAETFRLLDPDLAMAGRTTVDDWVAAYRETYNAGIGQSLSRLFPGVRQTMASLHDAGIPMVVVSNKGERAIRNTLEHHDLDRYVDLLVADDGNHPRKPDPSTYVNRIAPRFPDIHPTHILVVGDTPADIRYARNIGASICWARYGYGDPRTCRDLDPNHIIDAPADLLGVIGLTARRTTSVEILTAYDRDAAEGDGRTAQARRHVADLSIPGQRRSIAQRAVHDMTDLLLRDRLDDTLRSPTLVPILRAGLAMWPAANAIFDAPPTAPVLGSKRKGTGEVALTWPGGAPPHGLSACLLLDTVTATGDTMNAAARALRDANPDVILYAAVCYASPEAVSAIRREAAIDTLIVGVLSRTVDADGYLVPKINGDAGDKLYGGSSPAAAVIRMEGTDA